MTYAELAEARDISVLAARQLTRRHRWHKQVGNDGLVVVSVPLSALENPQKSANIADAASRRSITATDTASDAADTVSDAASDAASDTASDAVSSDSDIAIRALEGAVITLRGQLDVANRRADDDRARADRAEQRADEALAETRDVRQQLGDALTAERIARDEAAGLRTALDARKQWGLWRRMRGR
jgi:hypothetical protein